MQETCCGQLRKDLTHPDRPMRVGLNDAWIALAEGFNAVPIPTVGK